MGIVLDDCLSHSEIERVPVVPFTVTLSCGRLTALFGLAYDAVFLGHFRLFEFGSSHILVREGRPDGRGLPRPLASLFSYWIYSAVLGSVFHLTTGTSSELKPYCTVVVRC